MSGKVCAICRPPAAKLHLPRFTMDWAFPMNGRSEGDYSKEWRTRYFLGVAHTIFFGSGAHDICWSGAHDILWSGAHDIFWSGAHDIFWSGAHDIFGVVHALFCGVAHTILFGVAHTKKWSGAHDMFWSGAHDILWSGAPLTTAQRVTHNVAKTTDHLRNAQRATGELLRNP